MINIVDMAIQVGGTRAGHSFVLKKKYVHYQTNQIALLKSCSTFVMHHESISCTKISLKGYHILA
jgi:hypothetical protein